MGQEEIKAKVERQSAAMAMLKHYESRLSALLNKIRKESLEKLNWYESQFAKVEEVVNEFRATWYPNGTYCFPEEGIGSGSSAFIRELESVLKETRSVLELREETPDDHNGHGLLGRLVDQFERTGTGDAGTAGGSSGSSDGT